MTAGDRDERTLAVASDVARILDRHGFRCAIIGAMALAAHGYPRATEDVDLGTVNAAQVQPGGPALPVVDLPHLVAMKLMTGARRDELDVLELLERQPVLPMSELRAVCTRFGLADALERALADAGRRDPAP